MAEPSWFDQDEWDYIRETLGINGPAVLIDPNVRIKHNWTYASTKDVYGGTVSKGDEVTVFESESGLVGPGLIREFRTFDTGDHALIYIQVNWAECHIPDVNYTEPVRNRV